MLYCSVSADCQVTNQCLWPQVIVALSSDIYQGGSHCFKGVNICHGSKCANAYVADLCPGCKRTSLDMTPSLFKELADPNLGVIDIQWSFTS